ncbi:hypothetical protein AX17_002158 [Amanita inopinata Kibby_2008]|nr:hypothetical protein AX17_002158 [Amanita inopinata Kibby_2008]
MSGVPATLSGFTVLPVTYSSSPSSTSTHYLYVRRHVGSKKSGKQRKGKGPLQGQGLPDGRTLFVVNVPPDATERELVLVFKFCGTVERVVFDSEGGGAVDDDDDDEASDEESGEDGEGDVEEDGDGVEGEGEGGKEQPRKKRKMGKKQKEGEEVPKVLPLPPLSVRRLRRTGRTAHVVFLDSSSLDRVLSLSSSSSSTPKPRQWPTSSEPHGLSHYLALYDALRPPLDSVREHAASYMRVYDYQIEKGKQKSRYKKGEAIVDEDGFTLVTRGGAYGQTLGGGVGVASKRFQATGMASTSGGVAGRKRKKKGEGEGEGKDGFYAFQKAEKQRNALIELKKRWEEDKAKIEKLKASRRFNPY